MQAHQAPILIISLLASTPLFSTNADEDIPGTYMTSPSFNISYPLIASYAAGIAFPLGKQDINDVFPSVFSPRLDGEIGIGGGHISMGAYIPINRSFSMNMKASRMRTWITGSTDIKDRTYNGVILEMVSLGHLPGKVGIGYFRETSGIGNLKNTFTYLSVGVGW